MSVRLVFPHVEGLWDAAEQAMQRKLAQIMVASARSVMPGVEIVMLTNEPTQAMAFVDTVLRKDNAGCDWIPWLCGFLAEIDGEVLYMDTDIVIQRDLRALFNVDADVVLTNRGPKIMSERQQPFLFGCVAYRKASFWSAVRERVMAMERLEDRVWWGSQIVAYEMWMEQLNGDYAWGIVSVPCDPYNYAPKNPMDAPADKWVLHFKGKKRKPWMLSNYAHLIEKVAA